MKVVAYLIAWAVLFWLARRAERWYRQRALMKELNRIAFDVRRLP